VKEGQVFTRILAAIADDELAGKVIETTAALAGTLGAKVALVEVVDLVGISVATASPLGMEATPIVTEELTENQEQLGRAALDRAAAQFPAGTVETFLREGLPGDEIIATAREWRADLLIIGSHGRVGLERLFLGNMSEGVLRHAPCPVLVVPRGDAAP
jgi:nucleotide-binding universal stress UspA family protein